MANIMIVDDAAFIRFTLKTILEAGGHTIVDEAENGLDAISKFRISKPDVVILDILMPVYGGMGTLSEIIKINKHANVVMCSSLGQRNIVLESVLSGAKGFIVKPFQGQKVLDIVDRLC